TQNSARAPRAAYEAHNNEIVARFICVPNVLELTVQGGVARVGELDFPAPDPPDGSKMRIGFRPFTVQVSPDISAYRCRAVLRHTYFLGVMLRLDLVLSSCLVIRSRLSQKVCTELCMRSRIDVFVLFNRILILCE